MSSNKTTDVDSMESDDELSEVNEDIDEGDELETDKDNAPSINEIELSKKETYYYKIIDKYYKALSSEKILMMIDIIEGRSTISLRLLDWFVTRYANKYKVRYYQVESKNDKNDKNEKEDKFDKSIDKGFNVHISYKAQLKSYKKKYFDPFRRRKKFKYIFKNIVSTSGTEQVTLCTTIGQLNFFKWAFNNHVIEYVFTKYKSISKAMGTSNKMDKTRKQKTAKQVVQSVKEQVVEEIKVNKNGINIKAEKKETSDEIKIVLSFD